MDMLMWIYDVKNCLQIVQKISNNVTGIDRSRASIENFKWFNFGFVVSCSMVEM